MSSQTLDRRMQELAQKIGRAATAAEALRRSDISRDLRASLRDFISYANIALADVVDEQCSGAT